MKLICALPTFLALSATGGVVNASNDSSLRGGASSPKDDDHQRSLQLFDQFTGTGQYTCKFHPTVAGLSVCSFAVQTATLDGTTNISFNRIYDETQDVGAGSDGGSTVITGDSPVGTGASNALPGTGTSTGTGTGTADGFPTFEEQDTPDGDASDQPPAEDGNYDSEDTLPTNQAQLCVTNGVGATCPTGAGLPNIACCTSGKTGSFFNACCPADFAGITFGTGATDKNEFDMDILTGTGTLLPADCVVNANEQGCQIFNVPGNEPGTPLILPAGVDGPCVEIASNATCSTHSGTCTAAGREFPVCCPTCAEGTYLPGQSCAVILPDPAACGIVISGGSGSGSGSSGSSGINTPVADGVDVNVTINATPVIQPVPPTTPVAPTPTVPTRIFGSVGTGGKCESSSDCVESTVCLGNKVCASKGSCYFSSDCDDPYNTGWSAKGCIGKATCSGVVCERECTTGGLNNGGSASSNGITSSTRAACPATPPTKGANCCDHISITQFEQSCMYINDGLQCDCAGQPNDGGISYCKTIGWNCRNPFTDSF